MAMAMLPFGVQLKRVNIGIELVADPTLLFLDGKPFNTARSHAL